LFSEIEGNVSWLYHEECDDDKEALLLRTHNQCEHCEQTGDTLEFDGPLRAVPVLVVKTVLKNVEHPRAIHEDAEVLVRILVNYPLGHHD